jgi:hypothetical protein
MAPVMTPTANDGPTADSTVIGIAIGFCAVGRLIGVACFWWRKKKHGATGGDSENAVFLQ